MQFTNNEIYGYANALMTIYDDNKYIPAKANFLIQKNIGVIVAAAQEIERARLAVAQHYGELDAENNQYHIPDDKIELAQKELNDLFSLEQELDIRTFNIDALGNVEFTPSQMQVLMFMINED